MSWIVKTLHKALIESYDSDYEPHLEKANYLRNGEILNHNWKYNSSMSQSAQRIRVYECVNCNCLIRVRGDLFHGIVLYGYKGSFWNDDFHNTCATNIMNKALL